MRWLMLRGLAREKRHFGAFPSTFAARVPAAEPFTLDLCGFGTEHRRDSPTSVAAITDELRARFLAERPAGDAPWALFALSLGGMVALDWAARYPQDFAQVVVGNTSAADLSAPWERFSPSMMVKLPTLVRGASLEARERTILEITSNSTAVDKDALARLWAAYAREQTPKRRSFARQLYAATTSKLPRSVGTAVLVLTSRADCLVSWRCSQKIADALRVPLEVHDAAGHDLSLDAPEWICEKIVERFPPR